MSRRLCDAPEALLWVVGSIAFLAGAVLTVQRRWWV